MNDETAAAVRDAWKRLERIDGRPSASPEEDWATCTSELLEFFAEHDGETLARSRFRVPSEYDYFMRTFGGEYSHRGYDFYSASTILRHVKDDANLNKMQASDPDDSESFVFGYWLRVGGRDWKYDNFICCDCSLAVYGQIFEGDDSHPQWFGEDVKIEFPSFVDLLHHRYASQQRF